MATSPLTVLLGVPDEMCTERLSWDQNKFGGEPTWMSSGGFHPSCSICKRQLYLVVQVYCPLSGSPYHRTIYVFACPEKLCRQDNKSWSVLRIQKLAEKGKDIKVRTEEKWTDDADEWGSDEESAKDVVPSVSSPVMHTGADSVVGENLGLPNLEKLQLAEEHVENRFISHHMNVFYEPDERDRVNGYEERLLKDYAEREGMTASLSWDPVLMAESASKGSEELYEKVLPSHGDISFMKFTKRISRCPEQCLRYCWSGNPLPICNFDIGFNPPVCQHCGASRVFELQLMPALIPLLKPHCHKDDASLDFGTILIYTCSRNCWGPDVLVRGESAVLQHDPDHEVIGHL